MLVLIFVLGLSIRLIGLGKVPSGFTPDEAVQGYTAYSLLKTGHDEWGLSWPITSFRSFLDYKAPLQTYLMIPSIAIFGLNQFAVRLPSAIFGSLAIFAVYLLANELFGYLKFRNSKLFENWNLNIGHLASLTLALTPWAMQFSHMALEANLISFFFPLGLWAFLKGLRLLDTRYWLLTTSTWGLALFDYHSIFLFLPLFCLGLLVLCFDQIKKIPFKNLALPLIVFAVFVTPIYYTSVFGKTSARGGDLLITNFSSQDLASISDSQYYSSLNIISPKISRVLSNRFTFTLDKFTENYISYLTPDFWFTTGGTETTYAIIPGSGLLNFWQLPFIALAIYFLIKKYKDHPITLKVLCLWLFLSPLPAAITKEGFRPNRASMFLGFWAVLTAYGIYLAITKLSHRLSSLLRYLLIPVILITFIFWANNFAVLAPIKFPGYMSEGWRSTVNKLASLQGNYTKIFVQKGSQSQSFIAFYEKINPVDFQSASKEWYQRILTKPDVKYLDQLDPYSLNQFTFRTLSWPDDIRTDTVYLAFDNLDRLPNSRRTLYTYQSPTGKTLLEIFDFRK